jgi:hypothetical protein
MNPFEWLGFFISSLAVLVLIVTAIYDALQSKDKPNKRKTQHEEAERRFKAFLRGEAPTPVLDRVLQEVIEEDEAVERAVKKKKKAHKPTPLPPTAPPVDILMRTTAATVTEAGNSRVKEILNSEVTLQNMVVLSEVFGKPKGWS